MTTQRSRDHRARIKARGDVSMNMEIHLSTRKRFRELAALEGLTLKDMFTKLVEQYQP